MKILLDIITQISCPREIPTVKDYKDKTLQEKGGIVQFKFLWQVPLWVDKVTCSVDWGPPRNQSALSLTSFRGRVLSQSLGPGEETGEILPFLDRLFSAISLLASFQQFWYVGRSLTGFQTSGKLRTLIYKMKITHSCLLNRLWK